MTTDSRGPYFQQGTISSPDLTTRSGETAVGTSKIRTGSLEKRSVDSIDVASRAKAEVLDSDSSSSEEDSTDEDDEVNLKRLASSITESPRMIGIASAQQQIDPSTAPTLISKIPVLDEESSGSSEESSDEEEAAKNMAVTHRHTPADDSKGEELPLLQPTVPSTVGVGAATSTVATVGSSGSSESDSDSSSDEEEDSSSAAPLPVVHKKVVSFAPLTDHESRELVPSSTNQEGGSSSPMKASSNKNDGVNKLSGESNKERTAVHDSSGSSSSSSSSDTSSDDDDGESELVEVLENRPPSPPPAALTVISLSSFFASFSYNIFALCLEPITRKSSS